MQFGDLRHGRLQEDDRPLRIDAGREPIEHDVAARVVNRLRIFESGRERMEVGDFEVRLHRLAQTHPGIERAEQVSEVKAAGRPVPGHDARTG